LAQTKITIIDCLDEVAIPPKVREEVYKFFPDAKVAELKTGGNFPYLSRADETNMHLEVHLRRISTIEPPAATESSQQDGKQEEQEPKQELQQELKENPKEEQEKPQE